VTIPANMRVNGREYNSEYDAIIVGSGIGGLVCSNLLALAGLKVLMIERHYVLGGYCSTFRRKKFVFDAATHFYPLLGNRTTMTGKVLARIGDPTSWVKMDPVDKFHFPDGDVFEVPADFSIYLEKLKHLFPEEVQQIDAFFAEVRDAYLYGLLTYFKDVPNDKAARFEHLTLQQKLEHHFRNQKLRALLMADTSHWGSLPRRTSFLFDSMLRLSYFLGNYYPVGGSQEFADNLGNVFKSRGGHIVLYGNVEKILVEDGVAVGVQGRTSHRGEPFEFRAPVVVSNSDVMHTYENLLGEEIVGAELIGRLKKLRATHACFLVHFGLRKLPKETMMRAEGYHWFSWNPDDIERSFFKLFFPTHFEPRMAPPDHDILIIQKMSPPDYDGVRDWQAHKNDIEQQILRDLRRIIPDIDEYIVMMMSASANTSYRFTLNFQGAMLGWEMSPDQLGDARPSIVTPVRNLYLTGHWTQPGGGITPVIISAQRCAKLIITGREQSFDRDDMQDTARIVAARTE
jgi:phytoene dehydrogenase-like protein